VVNTPASYSGGPMFKSRPGLKFSWFSSVLPEKCLDSVLKLDHNSFLLHPFLFIIHISLFYLTSCNLLLRNSLVCKCVGVKFRVFWDVSQCSHVQVDLRFRGAYSFHHQDAKWPSWWRQYASLKLRSTSTWLHCDTFQKTLNFIVATVRTWIPTSVSVVSMENKVKCYSQRVQ
jgi:hypothetical protein